jgi:2-iminobutanoate/2-iminopropanoate deaminase
MSALEKFMARDIIRTPDAPSPLPPYCQAVRAAGLVFVSGTGPHDPVTGKIVGDTIQEQTRQCLENVSAILKAAGTSLERVASVTVILLEEADFAGMRFFLNFGAGGNRGPLAAIGLVRVRSRLDHTSGA